MSDRLSEERIARAWTSSVDGEDRQGCPGEDRFWEAACGALPPDEVGRLLDHTATCPACALALTTAVAIREESGLPAPALAPSRPSIRQLLRGTVLRPEAALAYLFLLAILIPLTRLGRPPAPPPPAVAEVPPALRPVRIVALEGDSIARGEGTASPTVLEAKDGPVVLRLFLETGDLEPGAALSVRLSLAGRPVAESAYPAGAIAPEGTLDFVLEPGALPKGEAITLEVRAGPAPVFTRRLIVR